MRRKEKEIKNSEVIDSIMKEALICRLAMCEGNEPYVVPMNFGYDGEYIYLHSALEGKKIDILKNNNKVCFEVETKTELIKNERICDWSMKFLCVIGKGEIIFIEDRKEKKEALSRIIEKYTDLTYDFSDAQVDNVAVMKVRILEKTGKKSGYL